MQRPPVHTLSLILGLTGIAIPVIIMLALGISSAENKSRYELIKDLFVPLAGPLVAVLVPVILFFVIPMGQNRQKLALDLCSHYYSEEMRDSRNTGWRHFVTEQRQLPPFRRAESLNHFLDYLTRAEVHRSITPELDMVYQKVSRVLDFFAMVNGCLARGVADDEIVRDFLLYYYLWWRDEIMDPLRKTRRIDAINPKLRLTWWQPLSHLDALAEKPI